MWIPVYIWRDSHFYIQLQPFKIHGIRAILDQLYLIEMTISPLMKQPYKVHALSEKSPETGLQNGSLKIASRRHAD